MPQVKIDNRSDAFATVVEVSYPMNNGDAFLAEVVSAMKNLGLNIVKARLEAKMNTNTFFVTEAQTSDKILKSATLEEIRLAILDILSKTAPEAGESLSIKSAINTPEAQSVLGMRQVGVATQVRAQTSPALDHLMGCPGGGGSGLYLAWLVRYRDGCATLASSRRDVPSPLAAVQIKVVDHPSGTHTVCRIITKDRPGLLTDIVRVLKDLNMNVISAEINTAGTTVDDVLVRLLDGGGFWDAHVPLDVCGPSLPARRRC